MINRPTTFYRGSSFDHTFEIPSDFADGHFASWLPLAQVRTANNRLQAGLVAVLKHEWVDAVLARKLRVSIANTDSWPADLLQVDLLLTSPSGEYYRTPAVTFECVPGVTEVNP